MQRMHHLRVSACYFLLLEIVAYIRVLFLATRYTKLFLRRNYCALFSQTPSSFQLETLLAIILMNFHGK